MSKSIKLVFGEDIRRRPMSENISFDAFKQDIMNSYNLQNGTFVVKYQDRVITNGEEFLNILNSPNTTIKFDIERKIDDLYEQEVPVKDIPKPTQPIQQTQTQQPPQQPKTEVNYPKMPNIFSTLLGMPSSQNQPQNQSNPLSMLMGFLPSLMEGNMGGMNSMGGGLGQVLSKNLPNIFKILTEELPKDKLQELIITIIQSIPRDQLINILRTALSSPTVQESIINTLMSSLDNMVEKSQQQQPPHNSNTNNTNQQESEENKRKQEELKRQEEELRKQEETKRRIEELKRQKEEIRKKQEEEQRKQEEVKRQQEELLLQQQRQQEEMKRKQEEEEQKRKVEEFRRQQENLQKQYEEQRKQEEQKRLQELRKQHEELLKRQEEETLRLQQEMQQQEERRRQLEQEEMKRRQEEELKRQEEIRRQQEENNKNQLELQMKLQQEQKIQQFMLILQNNGIPYECYRNAEEMGLIETHGIEKVTQLLIKHRGNVELVANELFN